MLDLQQIARRFPKSRVYNPEMEIVSVVARDLVLKLIDEARKFREADADQRDVTLLPAKDSAAGDYSPTSNPTLRNRS